MKQMRKNFHRQNHQFVEKTRIRLKREKKKITLVFHFVFLHFTVHHFLLSQAFFSTILFFFLFRKEGRTESKRQNQSSLKEKVESFRADDYKGSHLTEICFCHQKNARHNDKRWSRKSAIFAFGSPFLTLFFLLIRFFFLSGCSFFSLSRILFNHFLFFHVVGGFSFLCITDLLVYTYFITLSFLDFTVFTCFLNSSFIYIFLIFPSPF